MSRELLLQAFLQKESFEKHLDHVILEKTMNPVPRLLSHRNYLLFIPKQPAVYGAHVGIESVQWGRKEDSPVGYETTCFLAVMTRMKSTGTTISASLTDHCCLVVFFPDYLSASVSCLVFNIDSELFGVETVFLGSCSICYSGVPNLDYLL